jgi:hypothetical protein
MIFYLLVKNKYKIIVIIIMTSVIDFFRLSSPVFTLAILELSKLLYVLVVKILFWVSLSHLKLSQTLLVHELRPLLNILQNLFSFSFFLFLLPDLRKVKFYQSPLSVCTHFPLNQWILFHQLFHAQLIVGIIESLVQARNAFCVNCRDQVCRYLSTSVYFFTSDVLSHSLVGFFSNFLLETLLKMISILLEQQRFLILTFLVCRCRKTYCSASFIHWDVSGPDKVVLNERFGFLFFRLRMPFLDDIKVLQVLSQGFNDFGELGFRIFLSVKFFKFVIKFK